MNNKGFAITTILYGILIIFCLLLVSMLGMLSVHRTNLEKLMDSNGGARNIIENGSSNYINVNTDKYYETLSDALSEVSNGNTIKVLRSIVERETTNIVSNKNITLDLNGKKVDLNNMAINNTGNMTVISSNDDGTIISNGVVIINSGTFNIGINGGSNNNLLIISTNLSTVAINNSNVVNFYGGTIYHKNDNYMVGSISGKPAGKSVITVDDGTYGHKTYLG